MGDQQLAFGWGAEEPESGPEGAEGVLHGQSAVPAGPLPGIRPLAERLAGLAARGIYLGTSSWKYPGWLGQVYNPVRYQERGKFAEKEFEHECLAEYATIFPTVGGDFSFYQFPSPRTWEQIFAQVPAGFRFSLKVPEDVTVERFPNLPRYGKLAGTENPHFMDVSLVREKLLTPLEAYRDKLGVLIFEFGAIHAKPLSQPRAFAKALERLLSGLPLDEFKFAVEVRNPEFLEESGDYLECLRSHRVAHCLNSWTRMPPVSKQVTVPGVFTAPHVAARFLLRPGRAYQQ
ncbi:MAG TPA: DUF72 domain-containing protein, partial [Phycisphaerae bacterium]|nr:DUF72 domain-containing protein [Phycisphaerae bacterium]